MHGDARLVYPATARNRQPITDVLRRVLPSEGLVVEIASGSGEHIVHFAAELPASTFQPSDPSEEALASITAWTKACGLENVRPPLALDARDTVWPIDAEAHPCAILSINMIHIAPFAACEGLMAGAGRLLEPGGLLYLYGPFKREGRHTAPSNESFDLSLRQRDERWGVRDLADVSACAEHSGLTLEETIDMPANNTSVVFRRRHAPTETRQS